MSQPSVVMEGQVETTIDVPYLLVSHIECYDAGGGRRAVDLMWHKDLIEHLRYLKDLTLAAPLRRGPTPEGFEVLPPSLRHADLVDSRSPLRALLDWPRNLARMWRAVGRARVVHVGVIGWPVPPGWTAAIVARLRGRFLITNIESSEWRLEFRSPSAMVRLRGRLTEFMARWCVRRASLPLFTQEEYRRDMLGPGSGRGHVIPASWIDEESILSLAASDAAWLDRLSPGRPLRLIFAGRLVEQKGLRVLFEAAEILESRGVEVDIDIYGTGDLLAECEAAAARPREKARIHARGTVAYGAPFYELLRGYCALVAPSLGEEQPRVVYDAFSQALPVIASDTAGLRQCVRDGVNGLLLPPGDAATLARRIEELAREPERLRPLGMAGRETALGLTHRGMHERRRELIREALAAGGR